MARSLVRGLLVGFGLFCAVAFAWEALLLAPIGRNHTR
jgi:hypothetical protein